MLCFAGGGIPNRAPAQGVPHFGGKTVSQWIEIARSDKDAEERRKAVFGFGMLGASAEAAVPTLIAMLHDSRDRVRREAAVALGKVVSGGPPGKLDIRRLCQAGSDPP